MTPSCDHSTALQLTEGCVSYLRILFLQSQMSLLHAKPTAAQPGLGAEITISCLCLGMSLEISVFLSSPCFPLFALFSLRISSSVMRNATSQQVRITSYLLKNQNKKAYREICCSHNEMLAQKIILHPVYFAKGTF